MALVLVTGASGALGRHVVRHLTEAGHSPRRLVHRARPPQSGTEDRPGDLRTGEGLEHAVEGVDAVIHCATSPFHPGAVDVDGTGRLLRTLGSMAPSAHLIYISIVGVDDHPYFYYRAKVAAERLVRVVGGESRMAGAGCSRRHAPYGHLRIVTLTASGPGDPGSQATHHCLPTSAPGVCPPSAAGRK